jgi:alpha-aminoadipate carrier protein LysW
VGYNSRLIADAIGRILARRQPNAKPHAPANAEERMATCPECDAEIEVDEFDVDKGDVLSCPECGSNLEVTGLSPIELDLAADDDDDDDDDDDEDDVEDELDDDDDEDDEDEEDEDEDGGGSWDDE